MMKNGKIEFLRFFFCLVVLLFHCAKYFWGSVSFTSGIRLSLFSHGAMAVEFFFMLSGLLMAKSVCKRAETPISGEALAREYGSFMRKKYMSVFPVHCIGFVIVFVCSVLQHRYGFSQSKVKSMLFRIRTQLKEYLTKGGFNL